MKTNCSHCGKNTCDMNCRTKSSIKDSVKYLEGCTLHSEEQDKRLIEIREEIFSKSINTKELKNGMELTFQGPAEFSSTLLEFINFERACCTDITFVMHFLPQNGAITLTMTGSTDIKKIIKGLGKD